MIQRLLLIAALAGAAASLLSLAACTTTQERSANLSKAAATAAEAKKFKVGETNAVVTKASVTRLQGKDAATIVVRVKNSGDKPQVAVPIGVDLYDAKDASLYTNRIDGLEPALNMVPVAPPGETWWVNNQVAVARPAKTRVRIGTSKVAPPADLPKMRLTALKFGEDEGVITGKGKVKNLSAVDQLRLTVYAVATKGGKVVAAGRSVIDRVPAKDKPQRFAIYFTGDPRGADVHVFAPPSTLGGAQ